MKHTREPHCLAADFQRKVVAKGKCNLEAEPRSYKPLFNCIEFRSHGVRHPYHSWITGRVMHPVSTPEFDFHKVLHAPGLRVRNICEQVALEPEVTLEIARNLGVAHPGVNYRGQRCEVVMSTDVVATFDLPGRLERIAYAVKRKPDIDKSVERTLQKLAIEQEYWARRKTRWFLVLETNLPRQLIANMDLLFEFSKQEKLPCDDRDFARVRAWLLPHLKTGAALRTLCKRCDEAVSVPAGTSLSVAYHLTLKQEISFDLSAAPLPEAVIANVGL